MMCKVSPNLSHSMINGFWNKLELINLDKIGSWSVNVHKVDHIQILYLKQKNKSVLNIHKR